MQDEFQRLSRELAKVEHGELKAFTDKGKVVFMIQNAPDELRRLADALEKINVGEIQALVAYDIPKKTGGDEAKGAAPGKAAKKKP